MNYPDEMLRKIWDAENSAEKKQPMSQRIEKDYYDITHAPSRSTVSPTISEINSYQFDWVAPKASPAPRETRPNDDYSDIPQTIKDRQALHAKMVELLKQVNPALYAAILDRAASALWPIEKTVVDDHA